MTRLLIALCLALVTGSASAQMPEEFSAFAGKYIFHGTSPFCETADHMPQDYYECNITTDADNHLRLTGFVGNVDNENQPYFLGVYDADHKKVTFSCGPEDDGENIYDEEGRRYFIYSFTLDSYIDDEDSVALTKHEPFWFYTKKDGKWFRASYDGLSFTKEMPTTVWNGNIIQPSTAQTIDDLLNYPIVFENARRITPSNMGIMGMIYDKTGNPYAYTIVQDNGNSMGSMKQRGPKVTITFKRYSDLTAQSAPALFKERQKVPAATLDQATVVFFAKSFIIDGKLYDKDIVNVVDLKTEGGIEVIQEAEGTK